MKILSDFKDSYDSFQDYESDIIYKRFRKKEQIAPEKFLTSIVCGRFYCHFIIVNFCGVLYCGVELESESYYNKNLKFFYNKDLFIKFAKSEDEVNINSYNFIRFLHNWDLINNFKFVPNQDSPIYTIRKVDQNAFEVEYNTRLNDVAFYQVIDPYTVYQKLDMYLTNKAIPLKPIPEISNKDKIILGGFDVKTSFRKEKK